jgi:molybdopterin converting factor small subunit
MLKPMDLAVEKVSDVIVEIEKKYPGLESYLLDELGRLRQHVNIFVDGSLIKDREQLTDTLTSDSEVFIMQALSGG